MNANDCDNLGRILASHQPPQSMLDRFFALDPRIKTEYEAYRRVVIRNEQVMEEFNRLMESRYGKDWAILKIMCSEISAPIMEEARKTIYGEDYHPSLFR